MQVHFPCGLLMLCKQSSACACFVDWKGQELSSVSASGEVASDPSHICPYGTVAMVMPSLGHNTVMQSCSFAPH